MVKSATGGFRQISVPRIACFNKASVSLGVDFGLLISAMQDYVDKFVAPVWGTPATLLKTSGFQKGYWAIAFLDDADQPGALAYHDIDRDGFPFSKVFVRTIQQNAASLSVSASHQLVEMLVDPTNRRMSLGSNNNFVYAFQAADPVQGLSFKVNGIEMADFLHPAYFDTLRKSGRQQFDAMNKVRKPFEILPGGYQMVCKNGGWDHIFGPARKPSRPHPKAKAAPPGPRKKKLLIPALAAVKRLTRLF